ncbi:MAG: signal recognition particle-docking protein FtsY [Proteobacteria bacterium]|nr:signal recognition particle-docking protein FtsY [Pseudomonadota bacterium]
MNGQSWLERLAGSLENLTAAWSPGQEGVNLVLGVMVVATLLLGVILVGSILSARKKREDRWSERVEGILRKFERTERSLQEFKGEALRHLEVSRTELEYLRSEFETIRALLSEQVERGMHAPALDTGVLERRKDQALVVPRSSSAALSKSVPEAEFAVVDTVEYKQRGSRPETSGSGFGESQQTNAEAEPSSSQIESTPNLVESALPLSQRLKKSRVGLFEKIRSVFAGKPKLDEESVADLEAILVGSDLGIKAASALLEELKLDIQRGVEINEGGLTGILKQKLLAILERGAPRAPIVAPRRREDGPVVVLVVGVNGAGKTTSVAKLAHQWCLQGSNVLMVAADTFRAAAVEQLHEWGRRLGIPVVSGAPNAKPQTVVYDAMIRAAQEPVDVVIIDTAGRLHTKQNLMEELEGIRNAVQRHLPAAPDEVILVVDGSTGQNAIVQAREFHAATKLTGLIVTKLDGTSKGGVVVAIKEDLGIPIRYIGVGEGAEDLRPFVPRDFVEAILGQREGDVGSAPSVNATTRRQRRASST